MTGEPEHKVAIVVDSAASLPEDAARRHQLDIVPMLLHVGDKTYRDGVDLTPSELYRMMREPSTPPTTSAPSPASYLEAFRRASERAEAVLCLTVASQFSASFDSATAASREIEDELGGTRVQVLDTGTAAGGQGLVALEALRAAEQGADLDATVEAARYVMLRVRLLALLDTLHYLWRSGRAPGVAHVGTSLLRIKPIFELSQGTTRTVARPRTYLRARGRLLALMRQRVEPGALHATVMHADAAEPAEDLRRRIDEQIPCEELFVSEFTSVMGAHIGPGLLGVAFWSRPSEGGERSVDRG